MARPGQRPAQVKKKAAPKPTLPDYEYPPDWKFPKDMNVTRGQLHANVSMGQRYGQDPMDMQRQVGIADPLDPAQVALRQQAQNPPPQRGDMVYTQYGRVRDPTGYGGAFHKGRPHASDEQVNFSQAQDPSIPRSVGRPSMEALGRGLGREAQDVAGEVGSAAMRAIRDAPAHRSYTAPKKGRTGDPSAGEGSDQQRASATGATPMAKPYQPQMTDPGSGRKMKKGRPVANAGPSVPPPSVTDPYSGGQMKKGRPAHTPYSGDLNSRVALGLRTAGTALGMGFGPPRNRADTSQPQPPSAPSAPSRGGLSPRGLATPSAVKATRPTKPTPLAAPGARGAPFTTTMDQMQAAKPNTPGYSDFPPTKRAKPPPYPY